MPNLYPVFEMSALTVSPGTIPGHLYGRGLFWDFEQGDFVLDGAGRLLLADGHTAWVHWCLKTVMTERFSFPIYGPDYGVELEGIAREPGRQAVEARIIRTITESLLIDPRTEMVRGFRFQWDGADVRVSFIAVPVVGTAERLEVKLNG